MTENEIVDLFQRYSEGVCTSDEIVIVESWLNQAANVAPSMGPLINANKIKNSTWKSLGIKHKTARIVPMLRYAAAIFVILGITSTFYFLSQPKTNKIAVTAKEILPGGNIATLTLANGKQISLDSLNGQLTTNSKVLISNNSSSGVISYFTKSDVINRNSHTNELNTIFIPRGGQYQLVLADGTKVYLNSDSRLQYPMSFNATGERKVTLVEGEAYFEVAKDSKHPFVVTSQGQTIKVLGTHFNVSAYPDEPIKTTLAEGSIELTSSSSLQKQLLKPDQQAVLLSAGYRVEDVNASDLIAWKDGDFVFNQTSISDMLHQMGRWYNVDADFDHLPEISVSASVSKNRTLNELIRIIELSNGIKITITDKKKLIVSGN